MDQEELRRACTKSGIRCSDVTVLAQLATAADTQGLASRDLASKLSAWLINENKLNASLSSPLVERFVSSLQREGNKENQAGRPASTPAGKYGAGQAGFTAPAGLPLAATPQAKTAAARVGGSPVCTTPQSAPRSAFKARTNRGQVVSTLNPSIPAALGQEARMVHAVPKGVQLPGRHLYLLERLEDKVAAINTRIHTWQQWMTAALAAAAAAAGAAAPPAEGAAAGGSGVAGAEGAAGSGSGASSSSGSMEWAPVGAPAQEECYFAGRIVCEVEGGQLNDTAVMLEGDSTLSEGARVALDLSQLTAYRVFPGQVVAVRGINPSGSCILVKQLWSHLPPPPPRQQQQQGTAAAAAAGSDAMDIDSVVDDIAGEGLRSSGGLTAVVAAGPFCLSESLGYEPLQELLTDLKAKPPHLLVLLGPFVDVEQPLIAGGLIDVTFQQLFQTQVLDRVEAWQSSLPVPCQVVLLPAVRDAFHHPTFPQPALNLMAHDQQLVSLQNPCSFAAGPVLLAAQTTDVLRHLTSVELARNAAGVQTDRLAALASHVIGQRRFYPLYPPPLGTCLDLTADAALQLQQLPDLLLLPSDLAPFAKHVLAAAASEAGGTYQPAATPGAEGAPRVVVVNPGRLAKGNSGGTYAQISVAEGSGSIAERCRVDIIRV